jgi:hypothetical protein
MTMASRLGRTVLAITLLSGAGCGRVEPGDSAAPKEKSIAGSSPNRAPPMTTVEIISGSRRWIAQIDEGPAARDFLAQLPLTLTLKD